jgi:signal transduction histidine kinase
VAENRSQAILMTPDTGNRSAYDHGKHEEMAAWADMLARIGQKNGRLYEWIAQDSLPRRSSPGSGTPGRSILKELERERSRIARELHAGAGQPLAGIKINLELLGDCIDSLPAAGREALGRMQILTEQALQQVRAVSHNLHPPEWQGLKTEDALRRLLQQSGLDGRLTIDLDLQPLPEEPSQAVKVAIYRCAQECLSNVTRHSGATRLAVSLRPDGKMIELSIHDNGRGFPPGLPTGGGIGLTAIREHAEALDGTCVISGGGTNGEGLGGAGIVIRLPLDQD